MEVMVFANKSLQLPKKEKYHSEPMLHLHTAPGRVRAFLSVN